MRFLTIIVVFFCALFLSNLLSANNQNLYKKLDIFGDVFDIIKNNYVNEVDDEQVIENAINGMLQYLDPHSGYMNSEIYTEMHKSRDLHRNT